MNARLHPVEELIQLLPSVMPYPPEMIEIDRRVQRTSFFPGGTGVWMATAEVPFPPMPLNGIMIVGQDYHCFEGYQRVLKLNGENLQDPTWRNLRALLGESGIEPEHCFFTNLFMGVRSGSKPCGLSPAARNSGFVGRCRTFLLHQIRVLRPRLIFTLGAHVPRFIAPLADDLRSWLECKGLRNLDSKQASCVRNVRFQCGSDHVESTVAALTHPCLRGPNLRWRSYHGKTGSDAEKAMIADARAWSGV
jgi:uracil-DNA glycosylase